MFKHRPYETAQVTELTAARRQRTKLSQLFQRLKGKMAEWAEPCEWCARSNRVLRENLIAKTAREASHADSQKVCRVTRLRVLCT